MKLGFALTTPEFAAGLRACSGLVAVLPPPTTPPSRMVSKLKTVTSFSCAYLLIDGSTGRVFGHQVPPKRITASFERSVFRRCTSSG